MEKIIIYTGRLYRDNFNQIVQYKLEFKQKHWRSHCCVCNRIGNYVERTVNEFGYSYNWRVCWKHLSQTAIIIIRAIIGNIKQFKDKLIELENHSPLIIDDQREKINSLGNRITQSPTLAGLTVFEIKRLLVDN
jgi:hypothetical protein